MNDEERTQPTNEALLSVFWQLLRAGQLVPNTQVFQGGDDGVRIEWLFPNALALVVNADGTGYVYSEPHATAVPIEDDTLARELRSRGVF